MVVTRCTVLAHTARVNTALGADVVPPIACAANVFDINVDTADLLLLGAVALIEHVVRRVQFANLVERGGVS